jgi:tetratricopeptide (TPR) repeat protein
MQDIDQQWGVARALLGLGDLARLREYPGEAHDRYTEALPILQEIGARNEIARCLAGLGRVAMDLGATSQARRHLTRSLRLSQATGARAAVARGVEAFAALAGHENRPELAVQLVAAATTLRERAGLPPIPPARAQAYLAPAHRLAEPAIARLRARGLAMDSETAVALALGTPPAATLADGRPGLTLVEARDTARVAGGRPPDASRPDRSGAPP